MSDNMAITSEDRIEALDITRGIAVLGILSMNVVGLGLPYAYEDPTNAGGAQGADLAVWRINALLFEGTMRGLFTILFGASALLFLDRAARRTATRPTLLYYRRMIWLMVFGLINGYVLLWDGDILFYYGAVGLLLFAFRNLSANKLLTAAVLVGLLQLSVTSFEYLSFGQLSAEAQAARSIDMQGFVLNEWQREALRAYEDERQDFKPMQPQLDAAVDAIRSSYQEAFEYMRGRTFYVQTTYFLRHGIGDVLSMMLLGMALLKLGILTGEASPRLYRSFMLIGYAVGLPINLYEIVHLEASGFSVEAMMASYLTYDMGRFAMTIGHLGSILLFCRSNAFKQVKSVLAAVGRMALTNYLSQSIICLFIFTGAGLALYGQLQRHELYYIVLGIWLLQLTWSPLWLRHFKQGPTEWVWRRLTYGAEKVMK